MELLRIKNLRGELDFTKLILNSEIDFTRLILRAESLLGRVLVEEPYKKRMYYVNAVYSRLIDENKSVEHILRSTDYYNLIADYLIFFMKRYGI